MSAGPERARTEPRTKEVNVFRLPTAFLLCVFSEPVHGGSGLGARGQSQLPLRDHGRWYRRCDGIEVEVLNYDDRCC